MPGADNEWIGEILYLPEPSGRSTMIAAVKSYWERLRGERAFPRRDQIDPVEIDQCLPYISIINIESNPFRVQYRLVGTEVARILGGEIRGRYLDEMPWAPDDLSDTRDLYLKLCTERRPLYGLSYISWESRSDHVFEWAVFPFSDNGERVTHALSIDDYTMVTPRQRRPF